MYAGAVSEWQPLRRVLVHPPGIEVFFALLAPSAHLYERFFNQTEARREHRQLCELLRSHGVRVETLTDGILNAAGEGTVVRQKLVTIARRRMKRRCIGGEVCLPRRLEAEKLTPVDLPARDSGHLLQIALLDPTLSVSKKGVRIVLDRPLHNLYFMRDQQVATDRGMVMGRMATPERAFEVEVAALALEALEVPPVHRVTHGTFEGGDFIPAGSFALIGSGVRTDGAGIRDLLTGCAFPEIVVVHQPAHPLVQGRDPLIAMHLDTYVNFAGEGIAVGSPVLLQESRIEVFRKGPEGYASRGMQGNLATYLRGNGIETIAITTLEQLCYASNFLCVRDRVCITPDTDQLAPVVLHRLQEKAAADPARYGALLAQAQHDYQVLRADAEFFPHKKAVYAYGLEMTPVPMANATGGYGGAHCMTCPIQRS
jgi:arginine deiminase